jgi:predicted nucleic acid-binding Zn ribbon protein
MPTYVYRFVDTDETIEVQQAFTDDSLTHVKHPATGKKMKVKKVFTPVGVTFRGGGFYKTDSRGGSSKSSSTASTSSNGDGASSGDKASSEKSTTASESSSTSTTSKPAEKTATKTGAKAD